MKKSSHDGSDVNLFGILGETLPFPGRSIAAALGVGAGGGHLSRNGGLRVLCYAISPVGKCAFLTLAYRCRLDQR
jgi:hypothetical protein